MFLYIYGTGLVSRKDKRFMYTYYGCNKENATADGCSNIMLFFLEIFTCVFHFYPALPKLPHLNPELTPPKSYSNPPAGQPRPRLVFPSDFQQLHFLPLQLPLPLLHYYYHYYYRYCCYFHRSYLQKRIGGLRLLF